MQSELPSNGWTHLIESKLWDMQDFPFALE